VNVSILKLVVLFAEEVWRHNEVLLEITSFYESLWFGDMCLISCRPAVNSMEEGWLLYMPML